MNLKRLAGRPCAPDCEGDPAGCATRTLPRLARARRNAGAGGIGNAALAAVVLAGVMFVGGTASAALADVDTGERAVPSAAGAPSVCTNIAAAASYPVADTPEAAPPLKGRVTDLTGVLSVACASELTDRLADLERRLGVQMAILLVGSTGQSTIEQFATTVFEKWRLGQSKIDNGLLLVAALNDRTVRIEVGYGLEGAIPDIAAGRIIRERIVPAFREQRIEAGVSDAVDALVREMTPPDSATPDRAAPDAAMHGRDAPYAPDTAAVAETIDAQPRVRRADSGKYQSNGLPVRKSLNTGSIRFWFLLGVANVVLGVLAEWRKLRRTFSLAAACLVAAAVPIVMLPVGAIFGGNPAAMFGAALLVPTAAGAAPCVLGICLFRSARVRKYTAIGGGTLFMLIAIGREMEYSIGEVLSGIFGVLCVLAVIWAKLTGGGTSSSSSWSSGSRSGSSDSDADSFSGGDGASGGGGASGRW
jgi:uncharacterized protein